MSRSLLLAIDTATRRAALALGEDPARPLANRSWVAGYRHGEELLITLDDALRECRLTLGDLDGVLIGTGPGAFTGLRVGLATAKALAYALRRPIVGVASTAALAEAAWRATGSDAPDELLVAMPAGPHDRYLAAYRRDAGGAAPRPLGEPRLQAGRGPLEVDGRTLVAVDLPVEGEVSPGAVELGLAAQAGLGTALLSLGRQRLATGDIDDVAELVPAYATLPRGIAAHVAEITWSRDPL